MSLRRFILKKLIAFIDKEDRSDQSSPMSNDTCSTPIPLQETPPPNTPDVTTDVTTDVTAETPVSAPNPSEAVKASDATASTQTWQIDHESRILLTHKIFEILQEHHVAVPPTYSLDHCIAYLWQTQQKVLSLFWAPEIRVAMFAVHTQEAYPLKSPLFSGSICLQPETPDTIPSQVEFTFRSNHPAEICYLYDPLALAAKHLVFPMWADTLTPNTAATARLLLTYQVLIKPELDQAKKSSPEPTQEN